MMFVVEPGYIRFFTPFRAGPGIAFFLGILPQQAFRSLSFGGVTRPSYNMAQKWMWARN